MQEYEFEYAFRLQNCVFNTISPYYNAAKLEVTDDQNVWHNVRGHPCICNCVGSAALQAVIMQKLHQATRTPLHLSRLK